MSAYALPGFFPPLPCEKNSLTDWSSSISSSCCNAPPAQDITSLEKEEKVEYEPTVMRSSADISIPSLDVEITVKEAKVDALQLIQSLTNAQAAQLPPLQTTATTTARKQRCHLRQSNSPPSRKKTHEQARECAMQFELDVSFHGRQYTVVRSLHRIRKFRDELVAEEEEDCCCIIPELPTLEENGSSCFSQLQALLMSYSPSLESWLRKVITAVPSDSPSLSQFLLEPLCLIHDHDGTSEVFSFSNIPRPKFARRIRSLESIEEDHEEHYDE